MPRGEHEDFGEFGGPRGRNIEDAAEEDCGDITVGWMTIVMRMARMPGGGMENWEEMAVRANCDVRWERALVSAGSMCVYKARGGLQSYIFETDLTKSCCSGTQGVDGWAHFDGHDGRCRHHDDV